MTEEQLRRSEDIAARIIQTSQNALLLNLRFMDSAIFRLTPRQEDTMRTIPKLDLGYLLIPVLKVPV